MEQKQSIEPESRSPPVEEEAEISPPQLEVPSHPELEKLDEEGNYKDQEQKNLDLVESSRKNEPDPFAEEKPPFD